MAATAKAVAADPAPEALPPERSRLQRAIEQADRAKKRLAWLTAGSGELDRRQHEAFAAIETATALVEAARKERVAQPEYLKLLVPGTSDDGVDQLEAAQRRLGLAEGAYETLRSARAVLGRDLEGAGRDVDHARHQLRECIGAVVEGSSVVDELGTVTDEAVARLLSFIAVWQALFEQGALSREATGKFNALQAIRNAIAMAMRSSVKVDGTLAAQFKAAFAAMAEDADAELPSLR